MDTLSLTDSALGATGAIRCPPTEGLKQQHEQEVDPGSAGTDLESVTPMMVVPQWPPGAVGHSVLPGASEWEAVRREKGPRSGSWGPKGKRKKTPNVSLATPLQGGPKKALKNRSVFSSSPDDTSPAVGALDVGGQLSSVQGPALSVDPAPARGGTLAVPSDEQPTEAQPTEATAQVQMSPAGRLEEDEPPEESSAVQTMVGAASGAAWVEGTQWPCQTRVCFSTGLPRLEWPDPRDPAPFVLDDLEEEGVISRCNMAIVNLDELMRSNMANMEQARSLLRDSNGSLVYMAERTMAKSQFLHRQKEDWDRLTAEAAALRARAEQLEKERDGALDRAALLERQMAVEHKKQEEAGACILTLESEAAAQLREMERLRSTNSDLRVKFSGVEQTVDDICNHLQVQIEHPHPEGVNTLMARASGIPARVRTLERGAFGVGINTAFAVAYSHYELHINLMALSQGYSDAWEDKDLDELEEAIRPQSDLLANALVDCNFPEWLP